MKKSYNSLALTLTMCMVFLFSSFSLNAQVGVGTTTPDAQLDIVAPAATGNALQVNDDNTTNASSSVWVRNSGLGYGINLQTLNTGSNFPSLGITQFGTGAISRGLDINMDATTGAYALAVFQNGAGDGIYNQINGSGIVGVYNDLSDHGGIGDFVDLDDNDGTGVLVYGVDNGAAPTSGGDVFAFNGIVRTNTATGAFVNGGVLAGQQFGVGHGTIITHSGTAGRNAEFNITNAANADAAIFSVHLGQGSAIVAQNQNNVLTGTITVADFAYTGTDIDDHIGIEGASTPAAGWGIGMLGTGNWYGVASIGDFTATGAKAFTIDHPQDPANMMLKHFSVESNEVLNMYRGVEAFDASGKAIVSLPDYYDSININPSYQLTPIGAAMPNLYIESEIANGQFVIAGGVPNKKVSWQITAERNDPYFQQNPEKKQDVVTKEGSRNGKYFNPELYNQPKEKGMFYNANKEKQELTKVRNSNTKQLEDRKAESAEAIKEEKVEDKK
ncbi:hypothetical protein [Psychroserpens algicola]|uniref:T9SS C-terminal target domain-containing protein n=1 Tax=Psychroserpens algicola TaxID=1719034 RepID=A0ABT0H4T5_9FLAO|nr:hypothetical protein [Psychroserpens algicola]MCK8479390.1 hypothetical protein [Psychroserpens algicola]